ncbi:CBS domain-containing protein [Methanomassiliicoccus luminyensis]|uniref:CBS domain-containing protein n=1 Tax=Methanomassiliicoccus luminyensis TaxID=1080712 RepID=UPI000375D1B3|nr:CBS domain-containing protein [Methanomassiliicoccus luminyensis]
MTTVEQVMTHNPIVGQIPGSRTDVLKLMVKHNLTGIPIVKKNDGSLAGMITRNDIFQKPEEDQLAMIMTKNPVTILPGCQVEEAARLMLRTQVTHMPVVDDGKLVGILTPTDLLYEVEKKASGVPVGELALSPCVPIYQDAPLRVALMTFRVSKVNALPVLDSNGKLAGILTDRDVFNKSLINGSMAMSALGIAGDEDEWTWEGLRDVMKLWFEVSKIELPAVPVRDIMRRSPTTVFSKTNVSEAARTMRRNDFGQLPVVDSKDNLAAMLYDIDVVSILAK